MKYKLTLTKAGQRVYSAYVDLSQTPQWQYLDDDTQHIFEVLHVVGSYDSTTTMIDSPSSALNEAWKNMRQTNDQGTLHLYHYDVLRGLIVDKLVEPVFIGNGPTVLTEVNTRNGTLIKANKHQLNAIDTSPDKIVDALVAEMEEWYTDQVNELNAKLTREQFVGLDIDEALSEIVSERLDALGIRIMEVAKRKFINKGMSHG